MQPTLFMITTEQQLIALQLGDHCLETQLHAQ